MKSRSVLPENYALLLSIDLQKNKKLMFIINALAVVIALVMALPMHFFVPISSLFSMEQGFGPYLVRFGVLAVGFIAYIVLHEAVHGVAMRMCGTKKISFGLKGPYAFAGSNDYYYKKPYIFIALAPVVFWGAVLLVINCFVSAEWFWVVYLIQIGNISGAAGDFYVGARFSKLPADILVRDSGVAMEVFSPSNEKDRA